MVPVVPIQQNHFDCDLFMCKNIESNINDFNILPCNDYFSPLLSFQYSQTDVTMLRSEMISYIVSCQSLYENRGIADKNEKCIWMESRASKMKENDKIVIAIKDDDEEKEDQDSADLIKI
jgi:hypothetical protein